jgi:hypothetical protein
MNTFTVALAFAAAIALTTPAIAQTPEPTPQAQALTQEQYQQDSKMIETIEVASACHFVLPTSADYGIYRIGLLMYQRATHIGAQPDKQLLANIKQTAIQAGIADAANGACDRISQADGERFRLWLQAYNANPNLLGY